MLAPPCVSPPRRRDTLLEVMPLQKIAFCLICFFVFCLSSASAHDPLNSATIARLDADAIEVRIRLEAGTAVMLLGLPVQTGRSSSGELTSSLRAHLQSLYKVSAGGIVLAARTVHAEFQDEDGAEFLLVYPRPINSRLRFEAIFLSKLPTAHRSSLSLIGRSGELLSPIRLVTPADTAVEMELPTVNQAQRQAAAAPSVSASTPAASRYRVTSWEFLKLGVEHILTGYDHLLFLFGLLMVCRRFSSVVVIITCFTLAHSVTLILSAFDLVSVPSRLVEPLIAATIVYVWIENLTQGEKPKARRALTFGFGLIHGFGFAGALKQMSGELGGAKMALAVPLFSFNLGIELGQIAIIGVVLPALWQLEKVTWFHRYGKLFISAAMVLLGAYWLVNRIFF